jgi:hypothetical protein
MIVGGGVGVQIIEQTGFGVRSSVMTFAKRGSPVTFVVFPMLHLGSPAFYQTVRARLGECDRIVVEGVGGRRAGVMTLAYRLAGRFRREDLVTQSKGLDLADLRAKLVRPDLTAQQFAAAWRRVGWSLRSLLLLAAPLFGIWMLVVGPRRALGRRVALDDLRSDDEIEASEAEPRLDEALLGTRDGALTAALTELAGGTEPCTVGVCWGAEHVRAVVPTLRALGFRITDATWVTVFA